MVCFPPHRYFSIVWAWVVDITIKFMDFRKSFSCVKHNCLVRGSPCTPLLSLKNYCLIKVNDHTLFYSFSKKGWYLKKSNHKSQKFQRGGDAKKKSWKGRFLTLMCECWKIVREIWNFKDFSTRYIIKRRAAMLEKFSLLNLNLIFLFTSSKVGINCIFYRHTKHT